MHYLIEHGDGPYGQPLMKFTLTFDGELAASGDKRDKWEIRRHFHPQLEELWRIHPSLQWLKNQRFVPKTGGYWNVERHHSAPHLLSHPKGADDIDLLEPVKVRNRTFLPLVRERLALICGLKIIFLRKEEPGRIYQGGDLDNRIKTLCDALATPNSDQIIDDTLQTDPIYCLLEDDGLIASLDIETHRLLSKPTASSHEVHLLIEVDVRVTQPRAYNQIFLGG